MIKKIMYLLCFSLVFSMIPGSAFAEERNSAVNLENDIMPILIGVERINNILSFSSSRADVNITVKAYPEKIDKVKFEINLQKYQNGKWISIKTWNQSKSLSYGYTEFDESYSVEKGYKYRFKGSIKAYKGTSLVEDVSIASEEKIY